MNVYFNAEYTGTNKDATLISLGCISETGKKLYIEFIDIPSYLVTPYVRDVVFQDTYIHQRSKLVHTSDEGLELGKKAAEKYEYQYWITCKGHANTILLTWFKALLDDAPKGERIQLVSYCSHYDSVLLFNLFNGDLPISILNPYCYDIFKDVMFYVNYDKRKTPLYKKVENALSINFNKYATEYFGILLPDYDKEHSLYCAEVIKRVYDRIFSDTANS